MHKNTKKMLGVISAFLIMFIMGNTVVYAAEPYADKKQDTTVVSGQIIMPRAFSESGMVTGDGVRLRANPNTNAAILELMYWGESVQIDLSNSTMTFYYVKRNKTGTAGYVSRDYVSITQIVR